MNRSADYFENELQPKVAGLQRGGAAVLPVPDHFRAVAADCPVTRLQAGPAQMLRLR